MPLLHHSDRSKGGRAPLSEDAVHRLTPEAALLRTVAGIVPPGQSDVNPAGTMIQSLVAVKQGDGWRVALYQTAPAAFHGRPEAGERLTEELGRRRRWRSMAGR
jgi:uncharacterized protein (TIGR02246 family)